MSADSPLKSGKWFICISQDVINTSSRPGKIIRPIKIGTSLKGQWYLNQNYQKHSEKSKMFNRYQVIANRSNDIFKGFCGWVNEEKLRRFSTKEIIQLWIKPLKQISTVGMDAWIEEGLKNECL